MARIRTIKPKYWDDAKLSKISRDARLTFIALWNFADDNGVIISESVWLKSKIYPFDQIQLNQFEKWLSELVQHGFISLFSYDNGKFYYLPNFTKHQVINRPNTDDVFVPKDKLVKALEDSLINHGTIPDESLPDRKGGEGKGEEANASEFEKFQAWVKKDADRVSKMEKPFTETEYLNVVNDFSKHVLIEILTEMHNYKDLIKKNVSANLTFRKWAKRRGIEPGQHLIPDQPTPILNSSFI